MLSEARKKKGLSQAELARITGISLRTIQAYESGVRDVNKASAQTVYLLAQALGTSIENLLQTERIGRKNDLS